MTNDTDEQAINLAEPLEEIVSQAALIVRGAVLSADPVAPIADGRYPPQTAVVRIDEVLKGSADSAELTIAKPDSAYYLTADAADVEPDAELDGLFALGVTDGVPTLIGYHGVHDARQRPEFDRLLAGLPGDVPAPTEAEIRALAEQADAVVAGPAVAEGPIDFGHGDAEFTAAAVVDVQEVLAGEATLGKLHVIRGRNVFEVGARWGFPTDIPNIGVYFLDLSSEPAVVLNPIDPFRYQARAVSRALGD